MTPTLSLHDNVKSAGGAANYAEQSDTSRVLAETAARLTELGELMGWDRLTRIIHDLDAYSRMGRGTGPLAYAELKLVLAGMAGDVGILRAAYHSADEKGDGGGHSRQAVHLRNSDAIKRITLRNPIMGKMLTDLRDIGVT